VQNKSSSSRGSQDGARWKDGAGTTHTVNSANDPKARGGYYHSQTDSKGNKATAVFNRDGTLANTKANKDWR